MEKIERNVDVLLLDDFVLLLLATLAKNSGFVDPNNQVISLPVNYKQIIENILCAENGWKEKFSCLIDIEDYFYDHFSWEIKMSTILRQILIKMGKEVEYHFECDKILITFTKSEIEEIMSKYPEDICTTMDHFASLLVDFIYTREFQERFQDYSAKAVRKMHDLRIKEFDDPIMRVRKSKRFKFGLFK